MWQLPTWRAERAEAVCLPLSACGLPWRRLSERTASPHKCSPFLPASAPPPTPAARAAPSSSLLPALLAFPRSPHLPFLPTGVRAQAASIRTQPAALHETARKRNAHRRRLLCHDVLDARAHLTLATEHSSRAMLADVLSRLHEHSCIAAHIYCRHTCIAAHLWADAWDAVGFVPRPARAGLGWALPLNGCSQGLVVRGIIRHTPLHPVLYLSYKVFSKVSNSLPIHQCFPTASPYGAQSGGWIG